MKKMMLMACCGFFALVASQSALANMLASLMV